MVKVFSTIVVFFIIFFASPGMSLAADDSFTFTITPPLVKTNMEPGENFSSAVKVVNNNSREMTVYVRAANFKSAENGRVEFADEGEEGGRYTLKEWIVLPQESFTIAPFSSKNIPYIIEVPQEASPGGHYAGLLIGTSPPKMEDGGAMIGISQIVSSLIFVNIKGDILEKGYIRQFAADKTFFFGTTTVEMDVRFENTGNVHLKPVGDIKIIDAFNKDKGYIPINQQTDFGNVLPESERRWRLVWQAPDDFVLINRYKAILTLGFGEEAKQADYRELFFWLINVKLLGMIIASIAVFFTLLFVFIKLYIKQSIKGVQRQIERQRGARPTQPLPKPKPTERKIVDLRHRRR